MKRRLLVLIPIVGVVLSSCVPTADTQRWDVSAPTTVMDYNALRRSAYIRNSPDGQTVICAEPSPDVAVENDTTFNTGITVPPIPGLTSGGAGVDFDATTAQTLTKLAERSQFLQVQREALYRLCELQANSDLSNLTLFTLHQEVLFTIRILALSDVLETLSESPDGRVVVNAFLVSAASRQQDPLDILPELIRQGHVTPENISTYGALFSDAANECDILLAAPAEQLSTRVRNSSDVFEALAKRFADPAELRSAIENLCATQN